MVAQRPSVRMRRHDRGFGDVDRIEARALADMRQVDQEPEPVHLADQLDPEVAQPRVGPLRAPVPDQVSLIIGELDDADAEIPDGREQPKIVFDDGGVLHPEDDPDLARRAGLADLRHGRDAHHLVPVHVEGAVPWGEALGQTPEVLVERDCCVHGRDAAGPELGEERRRDRGHEEAIEDDAARLDPPSARLSRELCRHAPLLPVSPTVTSQRLDDELDRRQNPVEQDAQRQTLAGRKKAAATTSIPEDPTRSIDNGSRGHKAPNGTDRS